VWEEIALISNDFQSIIVRGLLMYHMQVVLVGILENYCCHSVAFSGWTGLDHRAGKYQIWKDMYMRGRNPTCGIL
jgi:hypothetical protein